MISCWFQHVLRLNWSIASVESGRFYIWLGRWRWWHLVTFDQTFREIGSFFSSLGETIKNSEPRPTFVNSEYVSATTFVECYLDIFLLFKWTDMTVVCEVGGIPVFSLFCQSLQASADQNIRLYPVKIMPRIGEYFNFTESLHFHQKRSRGDCISGFSLLSVFVHVL